MYAKIFTTVSLLASLVAPAIATGCMTTSQAQVVADNFKDLINLQSLDLSGNGGSDEVERRYDRYRAARLPRIWASRTALCDAVLANPAPKPAEAPFEVGVALQDDAQMPGADQTWPAIRVLFKAAQVFPPGRVRRLSWHAATGC